MTGMKSSARYSGVHIVTTTFSKMFGAYLWISVRLSSSES